ncbi:MAG: hypothetical protein HQL08_14270 [Nitrospirae bacterium]|nr:hypothetical protein [Nitrospirota bacterium]
MDEQFTIEITDNDFIAVQFRTDKGNVVRFVARLVCVIHGKRYDVIRYDTAHNCPHKDMLDATGQVRDKIWYSYLNNNQALTMAIQDIKANCEAYRERFITKWLGPNLQ